MYLKIHSLIPMKLFVFNAIFLCHLLIQSVKTSHQNNLVHLGPFSYANNIKDRDRLEKNLSQQPTYVCVLRGSELRIFIY